MKLILLPKNDDFISFAKELGELNNLNDSDSEKLKNSKMNDGQTVEESLISSNC